MILQIGSKDLSDKVTNFVDSEIPRGENVQYTLNGTTCVDRIGGYKHKLTFTIGQLSVTDYNLLKAELKALPFVVSFTSGTAVLTKNCRLDGALPSPYLYSVNDVDYCADIDLSLEEM